MSYKPWFKNMPFLSRFFITARLKFNYNLTLVHVFKINILESLNCDCGEVRIDNDLLFLCNLRRNKPNQLTLDFIIRQFAPFHLKNVLATKSL